MGNQIFDRRKNTLAILIVFLVVISMTSTVVSATEGMQQQHRMEHNLGEHSMERYQGEHHFNNWHEHRHHHLHDHYYGGVTIRTMNGCIIPPL
jgi:hypothetical protein